MKICQTTTLEIAPNIMHLDMPTVQDRTLSTTSVVTLDTGSKSEEEVPFPATRMGKTNNPKRKKAPWEEGTY